MPDVADGDCIASLTDSLGLREFKTLWDANDALKSTRPNPNQLVVGDTVIAPAKGAAKVSKANGNRWTFVVKPKDNPVSLAIILLGADSKPLVGATWEMTGPVTKSGTTVNDGRIDIADFPVAATTATLKVTPKAPAPVQPAAVPPVAATPPYPAPIRAADFKDKLRDPDPSDLFVEWTLKVGSMPSFNHESGIVARLQNLGGPIDDGTRTERTVRSYQKAYLNQDAGSGVPADIQDDLRDRHDTPGGRP